MNEEKQYNLYCDESCHLQHDNSDIMCVGGIVVPQECVVEYKSRIKEIKSKNGILHEIKWNTISNTHTSMYRELIDFFFESDMSFRCVLIKNKSNISARTLERDDFNSFYFSIIKRLIRFSVQHNGEHNNNFKVYLDLKDAHSGIKLRTVRNQLDSELERGNKVTHLQNIRSHESVFIQLADILIGAVSYKARGLQSSNAKVDIISMIENLSGYHLDEGTEPGDSKFSIYDFQPKKRNGK